MRDRPADGGGASGEATPSVVRTIRTRVRKYIVPILSSIVGFVVAAAFGVVVLSAEAVRFESTWFVVSVYKYMIGGFCVGVSIFLYYGPAIRERGYFKRFMPAGDVPASVVLTYFVFGGSLILTASTLFTGSRAVAIFWNGIGFSSIFALTVGCLVYQLMTVRFGRGNDETLADGGERRASDGAEHGALTGDSTVIELPRPIGHVTVDEWHASALGGLVGVVAGAGVLAGLHTEVFGLTIALFGSLGLVGGADPDGRVPYSQTLMRREAWYFLGGYVLVAAGMVTVADVFGVTA